MCINIDVDEDGREKLGIATTIVCGVLGISGFIVIILGLFIKVTIDNRMELMPGYDAAVLPSFLITVGIIMLVTNGVLAKVSYDCGYPETRGRFQNLLVLFLVYLFVIIWFIFAASMLCFSHRVAIRDSLSNGIYDLMKIYHKDKQSKVVIDRLQLDYECCGSNNYMEWTKMHWIDHQYLNLKHKDVESKIVGGKLITDDVPFSCCDYMSPRPCIHHNINNKALHVRSGLTLYRKGCTEALRTYFDDAVLGPIGFFILAGFFLQVAMMIMLRLVQTSIHSACEMEDPVGIGVAYIIPNCPCECCRTGDPMKYARHIKKKKKADKKAEKKKEKGGHDDYYGDSGGGATGWGGGGATGWGGGEATGWGGGEATGWGGGEATGWGGGEAAGWGEGGATGWDGNETPGWDGGGAAGGGGGGGYDDMLGEDQLPTRKKDKKRGKDKDKKSKSKSKRTKEKSPKSKRKSPKSKRKSPKMKKKSPKMKKKSPKMKKMKKKSPKMKKKSPKMKKKSPKRRKMKFR